MSWTDLRVTAVLRQVSRCYLGWPGTHCVDQTGHELIEIHLPRPPKCRNEKHAPPPSALTLDVGNCFFFFFFFFFRFRRLCFYLCLSTSLVHRLDWLKRRNNSLHNYTHPKSQRTALPLIFLCILQQLIIDLANPCCWTHIHLFTTQIQYFGANISWKRNTHPRVSPDKCVLGEFSPNLHSYG